MTLEDQSEISLEITRSAIHLLVHAPLSPTTSSSALTLAEAEQLQKELGKACAKLRGSNAKEASNA